MKNKSLVFVVLLIIVINFLRLILPNWRFFSRSYDRQYFADIYSNSQYVVGSGSKGIGDDGLYAFAGDYYFHGGDPSQVNFENPPLGKYLIGLSIYLFNNENIIYIIYAILILIGTYILSLHIYKNNLIALLSVLILSILPIFIIQFIPTDKSQLSVTMLDLPLTLFRLYGILFLLKGKKKRGYYLLSSIFFGLAFVTKFYPLLIILLPIRGIYVYIYDRKNFYFWLFSIGVIPIIYLISNINYFVFHPSLTDFIEYNKYIISWRLGNPIMKFNIIRTIFTGSYKSWWSSEMIFDKEWSLTLPILVILSSIGGILSFLIKKPELKLLFITSTVYLIYLNIGSVGVSRYLLPIIPSLIILSIQPFMSFFTKISVKERK